MRRIGGVVAGTLALLLPLSGALPAQADDSLTPVVTIPLPKMYGTMDMIAASGKVIVARPGGTPKYSLDNGVSWKPTPPGVADDYQLVGYKGIFYRPNLDFTLRTDEGCDEAKLTGFTIWDPAGGASRTVPVVGEQAEVVFECPALSDAVINRVVLTDGRVFDLSGTTARLLPVQFGPKAPAGTRASGISADGKTVVGRGSVWKDGAEQAWLAVAPTDGKAGPAAIRIAGLGDVVATADRVHYLVATKARLAVCRAPVANPAKPSCLTLSKRSWDPWGASLAVSQGIDQVISTMGGDPGIWLRKGNSVRKVRSTATVSDLWSTDFRDPAQPFLRGVHTSKGQIYGRVDSKLRVDWSIISPKVPASLHELALTPNRVVAMDARPFVDSSGPHPLWQRTFSGATVGDAVRLAGPVDERWSLYASGNRTVAANWKRASLYDGAKRVSQYKSSIDGVSGPYLVAGRRIQRVDGVSHRVASDYPAIFGSLVATLKQNTREVTIRDLARPSAPPVTVKLPAGPEYPSPGVSLWGDWIATTSGYGYDDQVAVALNYRTAQTVTIQGQLDALGDGYALVSRYRYSHSEDADPRTVVAWDFVAGRTYPVPVDPGYLVATDGVGQVAWETTKSIKVAKLPGVAGSKPRLLGVAAPASFSAGKAWKPQLDATKPLRAGKLEFRDAKGKLVRSIVTKSTASGSLRGLSWNGRDAKDRKVAAGTYTWTLTADAKDGSGRLTDVTGTGVAKGTVKVRR